MRFLTVRTSPPRRISARGTRLQTVPSLRTRASRPRRGSAAASSSVLANPHTRWRAWYLTPSTSKPASGPSIGMATNRLTRHPQTRIRISTVPSVSRFPGSMTGATSVLIRSAPTGSVVEARTSCSSPPPCPADDLVTLGGDDLVTLGGDDLSLWAATTWSLWAATTCSCWLATTCSSWPATMT